MSNRASTTAPSGSSEQVVEGVGAAPGIAVGSIYRYQPSRPEVGRSHIAPDEADAELKLLDDALERAAEEIEKVRSVAQDKLGPDSQAIFDAQELMLRDDEMLRPVRRRIREDHESASCALSRVLQKHRRRLESSDDDYLRDRANDLKELEDRLLRVLQRGKAMAMIEPHSIVVADRVTAADLIRFSRQGILGCVTTGGARTSHVSIIARALNIPAIVRAENVTELVSDRDHAILDGLNGRLILHPSDETLAQYRRRRAEHRSHVEEQAPLVDVPAETTDGHRITLRANVDFDETLDALDRFGGEGIGLMRTEMIFLDAGKKGLREERQFDVYRRAAVATGEYGATIRLLDIGGDKVLSLSQEQDNPVLGWRGIRLLLDRPDELLRPQVRALLRANAHGTIRMLLPMVSHLDEVRQVRSILEEEANRLVDEGVEHDPNLPLGVMVEVPSVALQAPKFAERADFLSIGTNDLTQYVLAVDRGNDLVADRFDALHPAVLSLVRQTVRGGETAKTPVAICGEVASDVLAVPILLGLGLEILSVPPQSLPGVNQMVTSVSREDAESLAEAACAASDAESVRRLSREWVDRHVDSDRLLEESGTRAR